MLELKNSFNQIYQTTIAAKIEFSGVSLHSGTISKISINPCSENTGIVFCRVDKEQYKNNIIAHYTNVSNTQLCTKLTNANNISVSTVEHLMAAFIGFGIDNAYIEVTGSELPILDGSSAPFISAFKEVGSKQLPKKRKFINILKKIELNERHRSISIEPDNNFVLEMEISHDCQAIQNQKMNFTLEDNTFEEQIAYARTYGFKEHESMLIQKGLALGASENNALVFDGDKVLNKEGLRYYNEPVRHKILDCIGDLFMCGFRIKGKVKAYKTGHELNNKLMHAIFLNEENWEVIPEDDSIPKNLNHEDKIIAIA